MRILGASPTTSPAPATSRTRWRGPAPGPRCTSASTTRLDGGGRRRRRRAEVAVDPGRRGRRAVARGGPRWLRAGLPADRLQVLLDLRFDRRRQHRPGRRGAARRARRRRWRWSARRSRRRPHRLPGASLRRRPAAQRKRHGAAPADADDRPRPPPLAGAADDAGDVGHLPLAVLRAGGGAEALAAAGRAAASG